MYCPCSDDLTAAA